MHVGDKVSYDAVSEAYCLLTSYIREEGKIAASYDKDKLQELVVFLADIMKHPDNFNKDVEQKGE
jgi:hypothetical protein